MILTTPEAGCIVLHADSGALYAACCCSPKLLYGIFGHLQEAATTSNSGIRNSSNALSETLQQQSCLDP
jgi:hypothetical protein